MIRLFDILFSLIGIILLSPLLLIIAIFIRVDSPGEIIFRQKRVGKNGKIFRLYKFRTMVKDAERKGLQLTVGQSDNRITKIGFFLRKYKLDELPQLFNVLKGDMSLVGPRPEVEKYVNLYTEEQRKILKVKPGITDYASIEFIQENELLAQAQDPEKMYIEQIMPQKINLNLRYIENYSVKEYLKVVLLTIKHIIFAG